MAVSRCFGENLLQPDPSGIVIDKTVFQEIYDLIMTEIETALSGLVTINGSMFSAQKEQYIAALFPAAGSPAKGPKGDGATANEQLDTGDTEDSAGSY